MDCFEVTYIGYDENGYFGKTHIETMTEKEIERCYQNGLIIKRVEPTEQTRNEMRIRNCKCVYGSCMCDELKR